MPAPVDIANLALSHLGISSEIQDLDNEATKEAQSCRRFYDQARDETLRDVAWPFATTIATLTSAPSVPSIEWQYAYTLPADCLQFRRIQNGVSRKEQPETRVPYRLAGRTILTDQPNAVGEYTAQITDPNQFPPDFVQCVAARLAWYAGPRITGGDLAKLADRAGMLYQRLIVEAAINAMNEETSDPPQDALWIQARDA